jgi:hypothetical protein
VPDDDPTDLPEPVESLADFRVRQLTEWNQWRAAGPIRIDGVSAFNEGDPVPAGHVSRGVVSPDDVVPAPQPSDEPVDGTTPKDA